MWLAHGEEGVVNVLQMGMECTCVDQPLVDVPNTTTSSNIYVRSRTDTKNMQGLVKLTIISIDLHATYSSWLNEPKIYSQTSL